MNNIKPSTKNRISVKEAARMLGVSEMFVRIGLQEGDLPIGIAVKTSSRYTYHISPKLLKDYIGEERFKEYFQRGRW